jgi:hypothetical protein
MEKRPPGRPKGQPYPVRKLLRMSEADADDLAMLAKEWRCTEAEAARRCIRIVKRMQSSGPYGTGERLHVQPTDP